MACYHPLKGWKGGTGGIVFNRAQSAGVAMTVPCGQCIGCRLERSRQWAVRIMHEAQLHEENSFITLTYADEHLPPYGSLRKSDFQKFIKRLRKARAPSKLRYFHCGEYGSRLSRPHYHACLFSVGFPDRYPHDMRGEHQVWRSPELEELWPYGFSELGSLTFESAAYVSRYITKKVLGSAAEDHYSVVDPETGELVELEREYTTMSRRPGIGRGWYDSYQEDAYPSDEIIMRGAPQRPPRYYDRQLERDDPELLEEVKRARKAGRDYWNSTPHRMAIREEVASSRLSTFNKRGFENGSQGL